MRTGEPILPVAAALAGVAMLALMDAFMKGASLAAGAYSAALLRALFSVCLMAPLWLVLGGRWPGRAALRLHLLRGTVSAFMALTFFHALTKLPIAETIAISFVAPLIALYLAAVLLGERIRREAVLASVVGFAGALVIIGGRLGQQALDRDAAEGLAAIGVSTLLYAWNFILMRQQALLARPAEIATFHGGVAALVLGVAAPWLLRWPESAALSSIGVAAALTVGGAMTLAWAYARAEAQRLVPVEYSGFVWAVLFGWWFFAERVSFTTLAGTALIVTGCLIAARRRPLPDLV
ncbi:DMT family transporter [Erythrobacteraceae bacterium CFH 75059]|uniref:DMT family transporter n=1 Tax=Qipengyuania thermophila TaxID=2509361 RepID=UPI0010200575|nr:DMT family transporter [Qipengyuania thermophila]TCD06390.1 DMT family transporter [Erythrobacteraceae bacterium CFH 75059]